MLIKPPGKGRKQPFKINTIRKVMSRFYYFFPTIAAFSLQLDVCFAPNLTIYRYQQKIKCKNLFYREKILPNDNNMPIVLLGVTALNFSRLPFIS
jgi:hypothetical protein